MPCYTCRRWGRRHRPAASCRCLPLMYCMPPCDIVKRKMFKRLHVVKQIIIFCAFVMLLICIRYVYKMTETKPFVVTMSKTDNNIQCHDEDDGDALCSVGEPGFAPVPGSIFYHETSCKKGLNSRQACSVESAARAHPERHVYVLFSGPITNYTLHYSILAKLLTLPNVHFARVHIAHYVKGTALESLVERNTVILSPWRVEHTSDLLRFVTLSKWSGIYLDTDMIVAKNLGPLGTNWVAREDYLRVNSAAIALGSDELAKNISSEIIREVVKSYDPYKWGWNGPGALTRVLSKWCSTPVVSQWSAEKCKGFQVYRRDLIFPLHYSHSDLYFDPNATLGEIDISLAYTHHLWNRLTYDDRVHKNSLYEKLASEFCPLVFNTYGDDFGS